MPQRRAQIDFYPEQRFSCSCCGFCCTNFDVSVYGDEKFRIEKLRLPGIDQRKTPCFSAFRDGIFMLVKDEERRCRFMDANGLCLIHGQCGATEKPLACRLYPFAVYNWADGHISADLRFICPAVGNSDGLRTEEQTGHIRDMAALLVPREKAADVFYSDANPAGLNRVRFVHEGIKAILKDEKYPLTQRLYAVAKIIDFHAHQEMRPAISMADESFRQDAVAFADKAAALLRRELSEALPLPVRERIDFRALLAGYLRDDAQASVSPGARVQRMWHLLRFGLGGGSLREINPTCPETTGIDCLKMASTLKASPAADELFLMFFYGKLDSMHFCSRHVHRYNYELGLKHLLLTVPVAYLLAATFAAAGHETHISAGQMRKVLTYVETNFALSPYFRRKQTRSLLQRLAAPPVYSAILRTLSGA